MSTSKIKLNELRDKIKSLTGLEDEEKARLLELLSEQKRYGLVWEDHTEDVEEELRTKLPVLTEVKERQIVSDDPDAPNHILIEGDNLHALSALTYTHEGKIDVIYIDPPYNTGKEFIYNDKLVDKEDGYKHSKWICFMKKRLAIAKRLLSDSGVILISIDNHEYANLKIISDEIFDEKNFVSTFVWETEGHTDNQDDITDVHEYILCYAKNKAKVSINDIVDPNTDKNSKILRDFAENSITKNGPKNPPSFIVLPIGFPCEIEELHIARDEKVDSFLEDVSKQKYISRDISTKYKYSYPVKINELNVENYKLLNPCKVYSGWTSAAKLRKFIEGGCKPIDDEGTSLSYYLSKNGVIYYRREGRESHYVQTVLRNLGTTETNKYMLERMGVTFDYPKPIELISYLLSIFAKTDSIILDFFAGSGTTMHATMLLNQDNGRRQCICAQNNYNKICESNYRRNSVVILEGHSLPDIKSNIPPLLENNLRYYKTDFVDRERTPKNMRRLMSLSTDLLCIKEDLYTKQDSFGSLHKNDKIYHYYADGKKQMLVIFKEEYIEFFVEQIKEMEVKEPIKVYLFSPSRNAFTDEFIEVEDKVKCVALPAAIYDAYQRVLPKYKDPLLEEEKTEPLANADNQLTLEF